LNTASTDEDVELVLVTGAGASCGLGVDGKRIPLMAEWSDHLVKRLAESGRGHVQLTGLEPGLDSMKFEECLGRFLTARLAFAHVAGLVRKSADLYYPQHEILSNEGVLDSWYRTVDGNLVQIESTIQKSLYELYAAPEFDLARAADAYRELLATLSVPERSSKWVYVTTNYDPIGEMALEHAGYPVEWGERQQARGGDRLIDVEGLVKVIGRSVPVLHLHGRVGWYRRTDAIGAAEAYAAPVTTHDPAHGTPIVMLPNPEKPYESDEIILSLWRQFEEVLGRARRVFVLGHSLHDARLVQALATHVKPIVRLAVTVFGHAHDPSKPFERNDPVLQIVAERLPGAKVIPIRFGGASLHRRLVDDWFAHMSDRGL
jgi:hypothetical protein